jgi:hypothetical protein
MPRQFGELSITEYRAANETLFRISSRMRGVKLFVGLSKTSNNES